MGVPMGSDSATLSGLLFQRTQRDQLQFEARATAFLGLLVGLTLAPSFTGAVVAWTTALLVLIAFLRWIAFTERFADEKSIIESTVKPVGFFCVIGIVHLFHYLTIHIPSSFAPSKPIQVFTITVIASTGYVIISDSYLKTYRLGWGTFFFVHFLNYNTELEGFESSEDVVRKAESIREVLNIGINTVLARFCAEVAVQALRGAIPETDEEDDVLEQLEDFLEANDDATEENTRVRTILYALGLTGFLILILGLAQLGSLISGTLGNWSLAFFTMLVTKHIVDYTLLSLGTLKFDSVVTTNFWTLVIYAVYSSTIYYLFFI